MKNSLISWMFILCGLALPQIAKAQAEGIISLRTAHGRYVVAESSGAANANRSAIGPWEKWRLINNRDGTFSLYSYHDRYLVAESNGAANANRTSKGPWEKWRLIAHGNETYSFLSHHGRYLVAESNGQLNANRTSIGAWEKFQIIREPQPVRPPTPVAIFSELTVPGWSNYQGELSWDEANGRCRNLGMRLPTVAEVGSVISQAWEKDQNPNKKRSFWWTSTPVYKDHPTAQIYTLRSWLSNGVGHAYGPSAGRYHVRCIR